MTLKVKQLQIFPNEALNKSRSQQNVNKKDFKSYCKSLVNSINIQYFSTKKFT